MIATPEAYGTSRPEDIAVLVRFKTGSGKPYIYFADSGLDIKVGDTVVVNTSSKPGASPQYVEVINVINDIFSVEGNHKRIVRVHKRSAERNFLLADEAYAHCTPADVKDQVKNYSAIISTPHRQTVFEDLFQRRLAGIRSLEARATAVAKSMQRGYNVQSPMTGGAAAQPQNLPREKLMLNIEKRTYINGTDAKTISDEALFELVISTEATIKHLQDMKNKSEKVKNKILQLEQSIADLNEYIDGRPTP